MTVLPHNIKLVAQPAVDANEKLVTIIFEVLVNEATDEISKASILKYFLINRQKLDLINDPKSKEKLNKFILETLKKNECGKLIESLIKLDDSTVFFDIQVPVLEETLGMNQIFEVDLAPE